MKTASSSQYWRRRIEELVCGELDSVHRAELMEHLRAGDDDRRLYDDVMEAFRLVEGRDFAFVEIDAVESWVFDSLSPSPSARTQPRASRWQTWLGLAFALAAAVLLVIGPLRPQPPDDEMGVKGPRRDAVLAIQALCGTRGAALQSMEQGGCPLSGTLSFAYRVEPRASPGVLTLFGVDESGDVLYYAPTPADRAALSVRSGGWRPLPLSIDLNVNHQAGGVRLFALLSSHAPTVAQVDALAATLADDVSSRIDRPPWHERHAANPVLHSLCPVLANCQSAELDFSLYQGVP